MPISVDGGVVRTNREDLLILGNRAIFLFHGNEHLAERGVSGEVIRIDLQRLAKLGFGTLDVLLHPVNVALK